MIRQYFAQRCQGGENPLRVGIIAAGSIYYLQDQGYFHPYGDAAVCRDPWIVEAFLNGIVGAARRNPSTGQWEDVYHARRSDMAVVRSLRDGRRRQVSVRVLMVHDDLGLVREPTRYPSLPDMRLHRRCAASTRLDKSGTHRIADRPTPLKRPQTSLCPGVSEPIQPCGGQAGFGPGGAPLGIGASAS